MAHPLIPTLLRLQQEDHCEFKATLEIQDWVATKGLWCLKNPHGGGGARERGGREERF